MIAATVRAWMPVIVSPILLWELGVEGTAKNIYGRFLELRAQLQGVANEVAGPRMWAMFLEHPWYQKKLERVATGCVQACSDQAIDLGDVMQDASLFLRAALLRRPDLGFDVTRDERSFAAFMRRLIVRNCLRAIRDKHAQERPTVDLLPEHSVVDDCKLQEERFQVRLAMKRLKAREQKVVALFLEGHNAGEIAKKMRVSPSTAQRSVDRVVHRLQRLVESGGCVWLLASGCCTIA